MIRRLLVAHLVPVVRRDGTAALGTRLPAITRVVRIHSIACLASSDGSRRMGGTWLIGLDHGVEPAATVLANRAADGVCERYASVAGLAAIAHALAV